MSGTRSLFRTAPVIDPRERSCDGTGTLIVAHGERGGAGDNRALVRLADRVAGRCDFGAVRGAVLKGTPSIEEALSAVRDQDRLTEVYPLFMSDGYYVREALPARLRAARLRCRIHRPFGLELGLAPLIAGHAARALEGEGEAWGGGAARATLLLIGHGSSKSGDSRSATEWQAARVRALHRFAEVRTAYLENPPILAEVLAGLPDGPCVALGFFSGEGLHAGEDVPAAIAAQGRADIVYAGPVTAAPEAARLISDSLCRALAA